MSVKQVFDRAALAIIDEILINMTSGNINATGKTSDSLEFKTTETSLQILGAKSFLFVERGRKPGKRPPVDPIREWVEARGIASGQDATGVAWAVANAIAKKGTVTFRGDSPREVFSNVVTQARVQAIVDEISAFKIATVRSQLLESFKDKNITLI